MHKVGKKAQFRTPSGQGKKSVGMEKPRGILCLLLLMVFSQALIAQGGRISFPKTYHYFGNIKEQNGPVTKEFIFTNKGRSPLVVKNVKTTCGCTVGEFTRDSVMPGDTGMVKITFDPFGRPGIFKKPAKVMTDGSPALVTLTISGQVIPRPKGPRDYYPFKEGHIRMKTNHLTFHRMLDNAEKTMHTILYNGGEKEIALDLPRSEIPPHLKVRLSKDRLAPGDTCKMWVRYDAAARKSWGFLFDSFYLRTNDSERPMKRINTSAHIRQHFPKGGARPRVSAGVQSLDFGEVKRGELVAEAFEIKNSGNADLLVRRVFSQCSCMEFKVPEEGIPPGESASILVLFNTRGRIGKLEKEFSLITNAPNNPEMTVPVKVEILRELDLKEKK